MTHEVHNYDTLQTALQALCDFLQAQQVPEHHVFDCKLIACELLGNVIKHASGTAKLLSELKEGVIELKIISNAVFFPQEKKTCVDVYAEHGRGLYLVERIAGGRVFLQDNGLLIRIPIEK